VGISQPSYDPTMKRHIEHAWTTATLVAVAALAIALAIAAIFFTRATAQGAALPASSGRLLASGTRQTSLSTSTYTLS
jgi:hypothetical protein